MTELSGKLHVWQAGGGYDRNFWPPKAIHASIRYTEENPVRTGLV